METQAKERLTGAIILVALVVLLVPELLTGPGRSAPAQSESPATEEQPLRSYTIELVDQPRNERIARGESPAAAPESPETVRPNTPIEAPIAQPRPSSTEPTASAEAPPARTPSEGTERPSADSRRSSAASPAPAAPAPDPAPAPTKSPDVAGWAIQVGSFASRQNAARLTGSLKTRGFDAFIVEGTNSGRKFYRVRVGPKTDRAAAEALAAKLRSSGQSGAIVPHP